MRFQPLLLAPCTLAMAAPAAAQSVPTTLPEPSVQRDAQGCWAGYGPAAASDVNVVAGMDERGDFWLRASGKDWHFTDRAPQLIRVEAESASGDARTIEARGFVDSNDWSGLVIPLGGERPYFTYRPTLSLYRNGEAKPFAVVFNPHSMASAALRTCLIELARGDQGSGKPAVTQAVPRQPLSQYLTGDDYPPAALRAEQQGLVAIRLTISAHGLPGECAVTRTSGAEILDSATCSIFLRRARFTPALDAEGQPTGGSFSTAMRWRLPEAAPPLPAPIRQQ